MLTKILNIIFMQKRKCDHNLPAGEGAPGLLVQLLVLGLIPPLVMGDIAPIGLGDRSDTLPLSDIA